jgi:hypothetical protein
MGMFRTATSTFTMGLVDFRSDKERIARSTRLTKRATHRGNRLAAENNRLVAEQTEALRGPSNKPTQVQMQQVRGHLDFWGRPRK